MCALINRRHRNSGFQNSRPLDYAYDREWTLPPDVFAHDASKAVRALSKIVVRPDFRTMFSNRVRQSVSIIPDTAVPYGMRAYQHLQWMKMASHRSPVDLKGRDSYRFRARCCARAVTETDMQDTEGDPTGAQSKSTWRVVLRRPSTLRQRHRESLKHRQRDQTMHVSITESKTSVSKDESEENFSGGRSPERVKLVDPEFQDENSQETSFDKESTGLSRARDPTRRIRGLSPSEETLIILNRYERQLVREAWEASLPEVDQNQDDWNRRAALALELEKDKWNLREKEIEALNRARFLSEERDRNRRASLLEGVHSLRLTKYQTTRAKDLEDRLRSVRRTHQRAMRKLHGEWCRIEKRRPKKDPVRYLVDPSFDGFAPQERFGEWAKRWHEYLPNRGTIFEDSKAIQELEECVEENWKPSKFEFAFPKKREHQELCVYLTKWTPAKLKMLHADLKEIRKLSNRVLCRFKPREWTQQTESTQHLNTIDFRPRFVPPQESKVFYAVMTLQRMLRGRAVQAIMYKGRRHNRELIREILSSKPFDTGEDEPDVATQGLMASTGWPRLKTYDEYSQRPLQEKWVQHVLSSLPPTLDVYNLMDFVNMNLMKMREQHDKSGENTETSPTPRPASPKASKTSLEETAYISCGSRPGKRRSTPRRRPPSEGRVLEEEGVGCVARVRRRLPRQSSHAALQPEDAPIVPTSQDIPLTRVETILEIPTTEQTVQSAAPNAICSACRPSSSESTVRGELRRNLSQRTVEIHGRSSSHVGFRSGPWSCRSPPSNCPGTPASIDTVTGMSRYTVDDFPDHPDDEEFPASEDTPSTDDTHIITDDATELLAAAFRAKIREQALAAQRIDEAPSPTDSSESSTIAIPILGRSVSQQRAPATLAYSASEEHARLVAQSTNSDTTITTNTSASSWTLNEAQQISNRYLYEKNRNIHFRFKIGPKTKETPPIESNENNLGK